VLLVLTLLPSFYCWRGGSTAATIPLTDISQYCGAPLELTNLYGQRMRYASLVDFREDATPALIVTPRHR